MTTEELEKKLAEAKKRDAEVSWESHMKEAKEFLGGLVGKTLITHTSNGGFYMFKVTGFNEKYYADEIGWEGQWHPKRWFELTTNGYIQCRVPYHNGGEFRVGMSFRDLKFKRVTGKSKDTVEMSKLEFVDLGIEKYTSLPDSVIAFGKTSYSESIPNIQRDVSNFLVFTFELDGKVYDAAREIAEENARKTREFWDMFKENISNSNRLR